MRLKYLLPMVIVLISTVILLVGQDDSVEQYTGIAMDIPNDFGAVFGRGDGIYLGRDGFGKSNQPVYEDVLEMMKGNEMFSSTGDIRSLFLTPLAGIDLNSVNIYPFYAKTSKNGTIFYFGYVLNGKNYNTLVHTYGAKEWKIDNILIRNLSVASLVSNTEHPQIILWQCYDNNFQDTGKYRVAPQFERLTTVTVKNNKLDLEDVGENVADDFLSLQNTYDSYEMRSFIVSPIQDKVMYKAPVSYGFTDKMMAKIGDNIVLCWANDKPYKDVYFKDIPLYSSDPELDENTGFTWYILDTKANKWSAEYDFFDVDKLASSLMPKPLTELAQKYEVEIKANCNFDNISIWKDSSIIFKMTGSFTVDKEVINFEALVKKAKGEAANIIIWNLTYEYKGRATYNRLWHPMMNGEIKALRNGTLTNAPMRYYDTDLANDSVIYLINGRPWQIIIE